MPPSSPAMPHGNPKDIEENKVLAAIAYIGPLCLVPLLAKKDSPFAQHHGKQGLVLFIAEIVISLVNIVPILGQLVWLVGSIVFLVISIMGLVKALNGEMWEVPVIGQYAKQIKL